MYTQLDVLFLSVKYATWFQVVIQSVHTIQERMKEESESPIHGPPLPVKIIWNLF